MLQPKFDTYIVDTVEGLQQLENYWNNVRNVPFFLDLETDSVVEKTAKIIGIGMCTNSKEAFYIPIRDNTKVLKWTKEELAGIYSFVGDMSARNKLINHNIIYDVLVFENNAGHDISKYIYSDTILMKHLLDENRPFGLKEVAKQYLGEWADRAQKDMHDSIIKNGGSATKENMEMWKADTNILGEYCCWDVLLTSLLFDIFDRDIYKQGLDRLFYKEEVMPLYREVTIPMKRRGFPIDLGYFEKLKETITKEINKIEDDIHNSLPDDVRIYSNRILNEEFPIKRSGNFPKALIEAYHLEVPVAKGKPTLAKKEVLKRQAEAPHAVWQWILGEEVPELTVALKEVQREMFTVKYPEQSHIFNLKSNEDLSWLFFTNLMEKPLSKTDGGKPQCDDDFLESIKGKHRFVPMLIDYKKLNKLLSTYIEGVLERQVDGIIYTSLLQFGTTSGRYSSTSPNLQNIPRIKDDEGGLSELVLHYTNAIKRGFVSPPGYKIVNADYSSLEPVCFAHVSNEEKLRDVFRKGYDLYSAIAIDVFKLEGCSADKKSPNYLKKKYPEKRQIAKAFCLAVVYGAEGNRIADLMGLSFKEANQIIDDYLNTYPKLKEYMLVCDNSAMNKGMVTTQFGRIRHLPVAQALFKKHGTNLLDRKWAKDHNLKDDRYKFKNALNNSKNFPIQGLASHIVNKAAIAIEKKFKECRIDGGLVMQVHDELTSIVREDQVELACRIVKQCMEETTKISVPLIAEPVVGTNWAESK